MSRPMNEGALTEPADSAGSHSLGNSALGSGSFSLLHQQAEFGETDLRTP